MIDQCNILKIISRIFPDKIFPQNISYPFISRRWIFNLCLLLFLNLYIIFESLTFVYAWQNVGDGAKAWSSRRPCSHPRIYITEMIFAAKLFHRVQSGARRWLRISATANTYIPLHTPFPVVNARKHTCTQLR